MDSTTHTDGHGGTATLSAAAQALEHPCSCRSLTSNGPLNQSPGTENNLTTSKLSPSARSWMYGQSYHHQVRNLTGFSSSSPLVSTASRPSLQPERPREDCSPPGFVTMGAGLNHSINLSGAVYL